MSNVFTPAADVALRILTASLLLIPTAQASELYEDGPSPLA
jgi:hypothetical protein